MLDTGFLHEDRIFMPLVADMYWNTPKSSGFQNHFPIQLPCVSPKFCKIRTVCWDVGIDYVVISDDPKDFWALKSDQRRGFDDQKL